MKYSKTAYRLTVKRQDGKYYSILVIPPWNSTGLRDNHFFTSRLYTRRGSAVNAVNKVAKALGLKVQTSGKMVESFRTFFGAHLV